MEMVHNSSCESISNKRTNLVGGRPSKLLVNWESKVVTSQLWKGGCRNGNNVTMFNRIRSAKNLEMSTLSAMNNGNRPKNSFDWI
jgi:hypothetical protein